MLYSAWVPGEFAASTADRFNGYLSELAAGDQPWSPLLRLTETMAGLTCLLGVGLVARVPGEWLGWLGMAVFAVASAAGGLFPLDCAVLSDPACEQGGLSLAHYAHTVSSSIALAALLTGMVPLTLRRHSLVSWTITARALPCAAAPVAHRPAGDTSGLAP